MLLAQIRFLTNQNIGMRIIQSEIAGRSHKIGQVAKAYPLSIFLPPLFKSNLHT